MPLFGRGKQPKAPAEDAILAIAVAEQKLAETLRLTTTGRAGLAYKPREGDAFDALEREVRGLLHSGEQSTGTRYAMETDEYGYRWALVADEQFADMAMGLYVLGQSFAEHGNAELLLAADFPFLHEDQELHWIFNHKRGTFYPFAPVPESRRRDSQLEMAVAAVAADLLPVEKQLERWFALWGAPFGAL